MRTTVSKCLLFVMVFPLLCGCSLLKRARVTQHKGIERSDFGLPIFIYPAADSIKNETLVLFLSGDGGWLDFEDAISVQFAKAGYHTIGFNTRDYFWERKTPRQTTSDVSKLIHFYMNLYQTDSLILCGYSFGADVVPFIYNRLHLRMKRKVTAIAMMSPFATTDFMVHTADLLNIAKDNKKYLVRPEMERIAIPVLCFYGEDEQPKAQEDFHRSNFQIKLLPGDHRYEDKAGEEIIATIIHLVATHQ